MVHVVSIDFLIVLYGMTVIQCLIFDCNINALLRFIWKINILAAWDKKYRYPLYFLKKSERFFLAFFFMICMI